jgi:murein DD-endopeptidase MepM/ murein hydrolase activator NlpD
MASALQRLRDNVKEQETFEEKVKKNPAEALRELYSSEEYKNYENIKRSLGFNNYVPPAYDLSDEFKAKEKMAWEELRKRRAEEGKNKEEINQTDTTSNDTSLETKQENPTTSQNNIKEEQKQQTQQQPQAEENKKYKVIATHKGVVSDVGDDYVKIRYNEKGKIYEENFKGLKEINVKKGDRVKEGQVIGQSDNEINVEKKAVASAGHHHNYHHHHHKHHHNHHNNHQKAEKNENQNVNQNVKSEKNENANATNPNNISSKMPGADIVPSSINSGNKNQASLVNMILSSINSGGQNKVSFGNIKDMIKLERNKNIQLTNKPEEPRVAMSVAPGM